MMFYGRGCSVVERAFSLPDMIARLLPCARIVGLCAAALALGAAPASADYVPGEVVVRYAPDADRGARVAAQRATGTGSPEAFAPRTRVLEIRDGESVAETVRELRKRPGVLSATPNHIARLAFVPDDPGPAAVPGGWQALQWNFGSEVGIDAPGAWANLIAAGRPGGRGAVVAVLDTGVAYSDRRPFTRSPDLAPSRFLVGHDFVDSDRFPHDHNGHGTHVASTIAESTHNGYGLTGIAYGARIIPVRVLDRNGEGDSAAIASGIRYAARRGADVINLSFEFGQDVTRSSIPDILDALSYARAKGALVVGASGNADARAVAYPARSSRVLAVGATTEHRCQAAYSNQGAGLDIAAPGGGDDAVIPGDPSCRPLDPPGRDIFQVTFSGSFRAFGIPDGYVGTSMAAPHVSATAALVIASGVIGPDPTPAAITARLISTATDLGTRGPDIRYGAGLINAARATAR